MLMMHSLITFIENIAFSIILIFRSVLSFTFTLSSKLETKRNISEEYHPISFQTT